MKNVLYLSIDGLLDPLGQSQIFPYLNKLSENNLSFFVCTIENNKNKNKLETFKKKLKIIQVLIGIIFFLKER